MLEFLRAGAECSRGKFLIGMLDLHSNMDCLNAMRGPQNLCHGFDLPRRSIDALMQAVSALTPLYMKVFTQPAICKNKEPSVGRPFFANKDRLLSSATSFAWLAHMCKYIIPAIAEEAAYLDHCVYHFDGEGALETHG